MGLFDHVSGSGYIPPEKDFSYLELSELPNSVEKTVDSVNAALEAIESRLALSKGKSDKGEKNACLSGVVQLLDEVRKLVQKKIEETGNENEPLDFKSKKSEFQKTCTDLAKRLAN